MTTIYDLLEAVLHNDIKVIIKKEGPKLRIFVDKVTFGRQVTNQFLIDPEVVEKKNAVMGSSKEQNLATALSESIAKVLIESRKK